MSINDPRARIPSDGMPSEQPFVLPAKEVVGVMVSFSDGHMERLRDVVEELERYRAASAEEKKT
jgi:hypothetical protein